MGQLQLDTAERQFHPGNKQETMRGINAEQLGAALSTATGDSASLCGAIAYG